jgi:glycerol dehydrogenase-like iron-containing ADH family enzyme
MSWLVGLIATVGMALVSYFLGKSRGKRITVPADNTTVAVKEAHLDNKSKVSEIDEAVEERIEDVEEEIAGEVARLSNSPDELSARLNALIGVGGTESD